MDFIRVELEEKYIADVESREECIAFSVYIKSGDFSGRGTFVYTVNQFRQLISQLKINIYYIRWRGSYCLWWFGWLCPYYMQIIWTYKSRRSIGR